MATGYLVQESEMMATMFAGVVVPAVFSAGLICLFWLGTRRPIVRKPADTHANGARFRG